MNEETFGRPCILPRVNSSSINIGSDFNIPSTNDLNEIHNSGDEICLPFDTNIQCIILSPKGLLESPFLATDQAVPTPSINKYPDRSEQRKPPTKQEIKTENHSSSWLNQDYEVSVPQKSKLCEQSGDQLSLELENDQQASCPYHQKDLNRVTHSQLTNSIHTPVLPEEDFDALLKGESQKALTENRSDFIQLTHNTDAKDPNDALSVQAIEIVNSSIDCNDHNGVTVLQKRDQFEKSADKHSPESKADLPLTPCTQTGLNCPRNANSVNSINSSGLREDHVFGVLLKEESQKCPAENSSDFILGTYAIDGKNRNNTLSDQVTENCNSSIYCNDHNTVTHSHKEIPSTTVTDDVKSNLDATLCSESPFQPQEYHAFGTINEKPLSRLQENNANSFALPNGLDKLSKASSELNKNGSQPFPLIYEVSKLETSEIKTKVNSGSLEASGLKFSANLLSLPSIKVPQNLPRTSQRFQEVHIENSKNSSFGTNICTEDITINQYVDLGDVAKGIHPNSRITVTDSRKNENCCSKFQFFWATLLLGSFITATVTGACLVFLDLLPDNLEDDSDMTGDISANYTLRLITRGQWSLTPSVQINDLPFRPAPYVVVCHTAGVFCNNTAVCQNIVRSIESWNVNSGFAAIAYNFLIAGDGYIYEGRGWGKEAAHTYHINCKSIGVAFVGNFDNDQLLPSMVEAFNILVEEGVRRGALTLDYKLTGAYQFKNSNSPGLNIRQVLKTWPHWGPVTKNDTRCVQK